MITAEQPLAWDVLARVDKFGPDSLAAAKKLFGIWREPTGAELLHWASGGGFGSGLLDYEFIEKPDNLLTTAGLTRVTSLITGGGGQAADNTHTRLGVSDTSGTAAIGDTDLFAAGSGGTHRQFVVMDATYPTLSAGVMTFRATHTTGLSNFHWQDWGVDISASAASNGTTVNATLLNHKAVDLGTKTSAASWIFTVTITLS